jgi:hypothetical protein
MYVHTATDQLRKQVLLKLKNSVSYYFDNTSFWQLDSCRLSNLLFDILWFDNLSFDNLWFDNLSLSQNSIIYDVRHFMHIHTTWDSKKCGISCKKTALFRSSLHTIGWRSAEKGVPFSICRNLRTTYNKYVGTSPTNIFGGIKTLQKSADLHPRQCNLLQRNNFSAVYKTSLHYILKIGWRSAKKISLF